MKFKGFKMKKIVLLMAVMAFSFASNLEFKTLRANFIQNVSTKESSLSYEGSFIIDVNHAFWHYKSPYLKKFYFQQNTITIIEPELEQVIITKMDKMPNLIQILHSAKQDRNDSSLYSATYEGVTYKVKMSANLPVKIWYRDSLDNDVVINLKDVIKDRAITDFEIFTPKIPNGYDIIYQ